MLPSFKDMICCQHGGINTKEPNTLTSKEMLALSHTESGVSDTCHNSKYFAMASFASILAVQSMLSD
ncbi:unnamed protein product [Phytomonas sp. Hart1]|nr:unnamed protein product [Phytomonas sp. Hart1]|eukprot:CCW71341.1 unnamed protein product [Phytomonas sp. isolate Hart1]